MLGDVVGVSFISVVLEKVDSFSTWIVCSGKDKLVNLLRMDSWGKTQSSSVSFSPLPVSL